MQVLSVFATIRRMDFEIKIIQFLQAGRTPFFDVSFEIISKVGSVLGAVAFFVFLLLFRKKLCFWWLFSYGFVFLTVNVMKELVQRPRPYNLTDEVLSIGEAVMDYSFPSGHVACATAIAIFLGYFFFQQYKSKKARVWIVVACAVYVGLVALSRMYLGKHYFTDIICGFAISAFLCFCGILLMRFYDKKKEKWKKERGLKGEKREN